MNAVEIEEAVSALIEQPFEPEEFPFAFLEAFGNKATTIKRLRAGATNKSDVGGVLQRNQIHLAVSEPGRVGKTLVALRESPATEKAKTKFILATDGESLEAEDRIGGETLACEYRELPDHFGFFLALAGISTVREVRENAFDIKATARLNRLYVQLLQDNPDWAGADHREAMNHFMARLVFCFFAEDTSIFSGDDLFTDTVTRMSAADASNMNEVIGEIFRAMNVRIQDREKAGVARWAKAFPYVNGGLFAGGFDVPRFSKIARSYLTHIGSLDWTKINPDIFGSMIQAVADDEERGDLGMHYTSVPNILKVLDPLFLDELRAQVEAAGDNARKLLNLRKRIARIRVFDPACGSGNFLVIAYKQLRAIENEINERRGEPGRSSDIRLTNFRGIELRHFSTEIARLALIIAEFQCDVQYLGQKKALLEFLPLAADNWITCGNALRLDWLGVCPPTGESVKLKADDLFETPLDQAEIDFENEGGETYICGNPPYKGRNRKSKQEKQETSLVFRRYEGSFASLDYVANWYIKAIEYCESASAEIAFVSTNSICQGEQVAKLWPIVFSAGLRIHFAHTSFRWSNLASNKAGVTVIVVGLSKSDGQARLISECEERVVDLIGPYLVPNSSVFVQQRSKPISSLSLMSLGNMAKDGGNLLMPAQTGKELIDKEGVPKKYVREFYGSDELINACPRACLWFPDKPDPDVLKIGAVAKRIDAVRDFRQRSKAASTRAHAQTPHRFVQLSAKTGERAIVVPRVSSERRPYLPADYLQSGPVIGDKCYALYDAPIWHLSLIVSKLHLVWVGTVCVRLEMRFSYANKIGWNTFPIPKLTASNKKDLSRCAENILLARERHFPATIADLYVPGELPSELQEAHDRNDEILERIYVGRLFRNDTERLEKLFEMYADMTASAAENISRNSRVT